MVMSRPPRAVKVSLSIGFFPWSIEETEDQQLWGWRKEAESRDGGSCDRGKVWPERSAQGLHLTLVIRGSTLHLGELAFGSCPTGKVCFKPLHSIEDRSSNPELGHRLGLHPPDALLCSPPQPHPHLGRQTLPSPSARLLNARRCAASSCFRLNPPLRRIVLVFPNPL